MRALFALLFFLPLSASETECVVKMQALCALKDDRLTSDFADSALAEYSDCAPVCEWAVRAYAASGDEEKMLNTYRLYQRLDPGLNRDLLEEMAWGVIQKGSRSQAPLTRVIALIAGAIANDARGVELIALAHQDKNKIVRLLAAEFSSHFRDATLQEALFERLQKENDYAIRLKLIEACGGMRLKRAEPLLLSILENDRSRAEERVAALSSLVELKEKVDRGQVEALIRSGRAGLRMLAAEWIAFDERKEDRFLLTALLQDPHPEVRMAALEAIGCLRCEESDLLPFMELAKERNPEVAVRAVWVVALNNPEEGQRLFRPLIMSEKRRTRLLAAAFLKKCGKYGYPLVLEAFQNTDDPYVRLNLAISLVEQRVEPNLAVKAIRNILADPGVRFVQVASGKAEWISAQELEAEAVSPDLREAVNQIVRLELINLLAIENDPHAVDAMKQFLTERTWGISGAAASLLLREGDSEALSLVRSLLSDPLDKVKLQAALVLGMWGGDSLAIETLEKLYVHAPREQKGQILEALGRIGDSKSLPFLVERLNEPQQFLRLIAAAAILQTLYH